MAVESDQEHERAAFSNEAMYQGAGRSSGRVSEGTIPLRLALEQ
jgi:hypothetical protein